MGGEVLRHFFARGDVAPQTNFVACPCRNKIRLRSSHFRLGLELFGVAWMGLSPALHRKIANLCAGQLVHQQIATGNLGLFAAQNKLHFNPEPRAHNRRGAAVVRLYTATGNYRVTALALRFGDAKFELTQLIPRHFETGHLIVLNPHIDAAECCRQAL